MTKQFVDQSSQGSKVWMGAPGSGSYVTKLNWTNLQNKPGERAPVSGGYANEQNWPNLSNNKNKSNLFNV